MENYFQAEAFNLDKVLDEFEQNEGELLRDRADGRGCGGAVVRLALLRAKCKLSRHETMSRRPVSLSNVHR